MTYPQTLIPAQKDKESNHSLFSQYQENHDSKIKEELIIAHLDLVHKLAKRFANKGRPLESLISVGNIGLIKAIDNYDVNKKVKFVTYATHCILGEIKRYFRDSGWMLKVPRRLKELNAAIQTSIEKLTQEVGRSPTIEEIATYLNISKEEVIEAMEAGHTYKPISLNSTQNEDGERRPLSDFLGVEDQNLKRFLEKFDLDNALKRLPQREQIIIHLFYYEKFSQAKIAQRLGLSQMHVSRLIRQALANLKKLLKE